MTARIIVRTAGMARQSLEVGSLASTQLASVRYRRGSVLAAALSAGGRANGLVD